MVVLPMMCYHMYYIIVAMGSRCFFWYHAQKNAGILFIMEKAIDN